ncbi:CLIP domain-containing serine protease 2-like [Pieris brassicae]|uniref:CLIP domain-containing serine protease 2-like n=1 Tax=Pieris brassicae TaxID=7116 RepID=UPI001E65FF44|nr:CLIP domain-containing serine protease 2-like [Pieris brassicae]XP_045530196.1 CLIP domain-containing serine protease 2-like [Pieris brassicae]XP_045530197.1 CLIP domain-containing serine protease 2-like [Pieris brassicae]XP_045530198.1 CLIP domain-containing serine protease 2-like [Pieris brassicae]
MLLYTVLVLFCVSVSAQIRDYYYRLDSVCSVANEIDNSTVVGTCKELQYCTMAVKLITVNRIPPHLCYRDNKLAVSCCPTKDSLFKTGAFRQIFKSTTDNFIRNKNITCYYDGNQPMVCCGNTKPIEYREPKGCPRLPKGRVVTGSRKYDRVMSKCWNYQKHFNKCVTNADGSGFTRENTCGRPNTEVRTIGGEPAEPREFPHMAVLGTSNSDETIEKDIDWIAGGALLSDKFILTAGHALKNNDNMIRYALLGTLNKTDIRSGMLYTIIRLIPHNDYDSRMQINDIALIELDRRVQFSEFIRPICLPLPGMDLSSSPLTVAGWGVTEEKKRAEILLKVDVSQKSASACQQYDTNFRKFNSSTMICAKGAQLKNRNEYKDTCQGDSGSPVTMRSRDVSCSYIAIAVVSHGPECGSGAPAVYTKVEPFLDWIIDTVWPELANYT